MNKAVHTFYATRVDTIEPQDILEFKPNRVENKSIEELVKKVDKILNTSSKVIYEKGITIHRLIFSPELIIELTNYYENNEKNRFRKDKNSLLVNHGIRINILYDKDNISSTQVFGIEYCIREFYSQSPKQGRILEQP